MLRQFGVDAPAPDSLLSEPGPFARGWASALTRFQQEETRTPPRILEETRDWIRDELNTIARGPANDRNRALMAEVEACLRLSWIGCVRRLREGKEPTPDFRVEELYVEVYCPQEHTHEREVIARVLSKGIEEATGPVKVAVAISRPLTGSGRRVDKQGEVRRDSSSKALKYPVNKTIDRVLDGKRNSRQFLEGRKCLIWLDAKHGLQLGANGCIPLSSETAVDPSIIGMVGVWHAFYGKVGEPLFVERTTLEYPVPLRTYPQQRDGFFRSRSEVSAAIISVFGGVLLFENPWAQIPLDDDDTNRLLGLAEVRPELSFWNHGPGRLEAQINAQLDRIRWLVDSSHRRGPT